MFMIRKQQVFYTTRNMLHYPHVKSFLSQMILDATSNMAALEVGGGPWFNGWKGTTVVNEVVNNIVGTQIDVGSLFPIPFLKPPGL